MKDYPDPVELREWAAELMPFTSVEDIEMTPDGNAQLVGYGGQDIDGPVSVRYVFDPAYINVETAKGEWHRASDISWTDVDHRKAWELADDVELSEDFICATGIHPDPNEPYMVQSYWILGMVGIETHREE
jgi:hypothetical protein